MKIFFFSLFFFTTAWAKPSMEKYLTQEAAESRSKLIQSPYYDMHINLSEHQGYQGKSTIHFKLKKRRDLRLDFRKGENLQLTINKKAVKSINYNGVALILPKKLLKKGLNTVELSFSHPYSTAGIGLHRFQDPEDEAVYLYTNFEPFDGNEFAPFFDQPDLRSTYKLQVEAPAHWEVITSVREEKKSTQGKRSTWSFPLSQSFSTYIFPLHAGPFTKWESKAGKVPLRLFARKKLAKYINVQEFFDITQQGFKFFNEYFGVDYPFSKYDQVFVPDFPAGAMENVGAVTFTERRVPRGKATYNQREALAETILHELAHMWFGNLVTMKWWNGLWLNESFATYMEAMAMGATKQFGKTTWQSFNSGMKRWAYRADQLVTTHPIEAKVPNTDVAFSNFDGITYGKGASSLKQLAFYLGADNFKKGVQLYFKKYAYSNTELQDFIGALEESSEVKLDKWVDLWLEKPSLNTIQAAYTCANNRIDSFVLKQSAPQEHPYLRPHRTVIGLFKKNAQGRLVLVQQSPVSYEKDRTTVASFIGKPCPDFVYPNLDDHDFVKVTLDQRSLKTAEANLETLDETLLTSMVWDNLWDMVQDGTYSLNRYVNLAIQKLNYKSNYKLLSGVFRRLGSAVTYYNTFRNDDALEKLSLQQLQKIQTFFWQNLKKSPARSDMQKLWFDSYTTVATTSQHIDRLYQLLRRRLSVRGLSLDQDRRWKLIGKLNRYGHKQASTLLAYEQKKDLSDQGQKMAIFAQAVRPELKVKASWLKTIEQNSEKLPLSKLKYAMAAMFPSSQLSLRQQFATTFYDHLPQLSQDKDNDFLEAYSWQLAPKLCTTQSSQDLKRFIKDHPKFPDIVTKNLRIAHQDNERCVNIKTLARK